MDSAAIARATEGAMTGAMPKALTRSMTVMGGRAATKKVRAESRDQSKRGVLMRWRASVKRSGYRGLGYCRMGALWQKGM